MTLANDLVQFLMSLFGDRQAAQDFLDDPERVLEDHGLGGVCSADVDAAMPVVLDYAPITVNASRFDREYNTGGNSADTGHNGGGGGAVTPPPGGGGNGGHHDHDDHAHAIQQLHHVVNNYSYTSTVDDRDNIVDQSVNQNIWADGDVKQWFDNDSVIASGDRSIAAGDDADVDDSNNIEDSYNDNSDNSTDNSTDNSIRAGGDINIGNEETDIDDSFNTDVDLDVDDSFNDNSDNSTNDSNNDNSDNSDNSTDIDVDLDNVGNTTDNSDNSTNTDVDIEDSFQDNSDNSTNLDVDLDNVANTNDSSDNSTSTTTTDNSDNSINTDVEIEDSFQDNSVEVEDSFQDNSLEVEDSFQDNSETTTEIEVEDNTLTL